MKTESSKQILNSDRIVATLVLGILSSVGFWAGNSLSGLSEQVTKLQIQMETTTDTVDDLRSSAREMVTGQSMIAIIVERMSADDVREAQDAVRLKDIEKRLTALEWK